MNKNLLVLGTTFLSQAIFAGMLQGTALELNSIAAMVCSTHSYQGRNVNEPNKGTIYLHSWNTTVENNQVMLNGQCSSKIVKNQSGQLEAIDGYNIQLKMKIERNSEHQLISALLEGHVGEQSIKSTFTLGQSFFSMKKNSIVTHDSLDHISIGHGLFDVFKSKKFGYLLTRESSKCFSDDRFGNEISK